MKQKKRANHLYQKNMVLGKKADGTYIRKTIYGKTQKELDRRAMEISRQLNNGIQVWDNGLLFEELSDIWFNQYNPDASEHWKYKTEAVIRLHLNPYIGQMKIRDLRQIHLQTIISSLAKKGYATGTLKGIKQTAVRIMKVAVGSDLIMRNPFQEVKVPMKEQEHRRALTEKEIVLIINTWRGHKFGPLAMIMLFTGLRRGEALALNWEDIDFKSRMIKVTKSVQTLKGVTKLKAPKTKTSIREVPIPNMLFSMLMELRKQKGLITADQNGNIYSSSAYESEWLSYLNYLNECAGGHNGKGTNVPRVQVIDHITAHMLRHTYATMLFDANVDVKSAQRFLGHADVEMTLSVYTHLTKYKEDNAIEALNTHLDEMSKNISFSNNIVPFASKN